MNERSLGKTGLRVSELGFGCGAVGGLLVRGDPAEMSRAVAYAIDAGITYFDTARSYGNGLSETNLGRILAEQQATVIVGSKVQLSGAEMTRIESAIVSAVEDSLRRLRRETIDLMQLHNAITVQRNPERGWVALSDVEQALNAFAKLQQQGKIRFYGINGLGDSESIHQAVDLGQAQTIQACFNLLNPTAGVPTPANFPFQDYRQLIDQATEQQMGVIAIRVLAAGALSGTADRHSVAAEAVAPIASGSDLLDDAQRAQRFQFLIEQGYAENLVELAIRFALSKPEVSTTLVGLSSFEQLQQAIAAAEKGPLPAAALDQLPSVWAG